MDKLFFVPEPSQVHGEQKEKSKGKGKRGRRKRNPRLEVLTKKVKIVLSRRENGKGLAEAMAKRKMY